MTTFNFCVQILYTVENARGAGEVIAAGIMIKPYNIYGIILIGTYTAFDDSDFYSPPNGGVTHFALIAGRAYLNIHRRNSDSSEQGEHHECREENRNLLCHVDVLLCL